MAVTADSCGDGSNASVGRIDRFKGMLDRRAHMTGGAGAIRAGSIGISGTNSAMAVVYVADLCTPWDVIAGFSLKRATGRQIVRCNKRLIAKI